MRLRLERSTLTGTLFPRPSKSESIRALFFASLAEGTSLLTNLLDSPDVEAAIRACRAFGAVIERSGREVSVQGVGGRICSHAALDAGNSGLVYRFGLALSALGEREVTMTGDESILTRRPIAPLIEALTSLGARIQQRPLRVKGPLHAGSVKLLGEDSQPVSALLIASVFLEGKTEITVENPGEKPWVDLTLSWFDRLGISYTREGYHFFSVPGKVIYKGFHYVVPGDFSTISYPVAAAILTGGTLTVQGLDFKQPQGDKEILFLLKRMGANLEIDEASGSLWVHRGARLQGITLDCNAMIDAVPLLAVLGTFASGETKIQNCRIARFKECDRLKCMAEELKKMGGRVIEMEDGLLIQQGALRGAHLDSHLDHRVALSLAVAALASPGETVIERAGCMEKTYPGFVKEFQEIGANVCEHSIHRV